MPVRPAGLTFLIPGSAQKRRVPESSRGGASATHSANAPARVARGTNGASCRRVLPLRSERELYVRVDTHPYNSAPKAEPVGPREASLADCSHGLTVHLPSALGAVARELQMVACGAKAAHVRPNLGELGVRELSRDVGH